MFASAGVAMEAGVAPRHEFAYRLTAVVPWPSGRSAEVVAKRRIGHGHDFRRGRVYHKGRAPLDRAERSSAHPEEKFERTARKALSTLVAELQAALRRWWRADWFPATGSAPAPASILRSIALVHAAEGESYRRVPSAPAKPAASCARDPAKEIECGPPRLGIAPARLAARLAELEKGARGGPGPGTRRDGRWPGGSLAR